VNTPFGMVGTNYVFAEGTSAAAPHIAGLGALLDSQYGGTLNGSQILTAIQQNADDLGKPGADPFYGKGRMNTCRTLSNLPTGPDCIPVPNP
jgi:subtilisin family serine protease